MSRANRLNRATMSSSSSERCESRAGVKASANRSNRVWPVLCSSSSDEESAQQAHRKAGENLTLNLTPHRMFGVASVPPAVLIPFATPCPQRRQRSDLDQLAGCRAETWAAPAAL